jgi:hypothetical protein
MSGKTVPTQVASEIAEALKSLLGKEVQVQATKGDEPMELVLRYVDGSGDLISAWTFDKGLAWGLGAALTMMPADSVKEALVSGDTDGQLGENFHEVANVLATVPANILSRRSVLESVSNDAGNLQRTARQISAAGAHWNVLDVAVDGYPNGRIAISLVRELDSPT